MKVKKVSAKGGKKTAKKLKVKKKPFKKAVKPVKAVRKVVAKKAPQPPRVPRIKGVPPSLEQIERLLARGQMRGFVTENEMLQYFPEVEDSSGL